MDIRVANFSLGRRTIYAGLDDFDQEFEMLLANGIVPVVSTGNAGPALLTTASPASAFSAIAVGAGSPVHQDRITGDVGFFGKAGKGDTLRPFAPGQTAWFSSRGPNADGRQGPSVMADGFGVYGAGLANRSDRVSLGIGSSFASPNVAGIAALLWEATPGTTATKIRNAIVESGNASIIEGGDTVDDQGNGWVDAAQALSGLEDADDALPRPPSPATLVKDNIGENIGGPGNDNIPHESRTWRPSGCDLRSFADRWGDHCFAVQHTDKRHLRRTGALLWQRATVGHPHRQDIHRGTYGSVL